MLSFFRIPDSESEIKNDPQSQEIVSPDIASILAPRENLLIFKTYLFTVSPLGHALSLRSFDIVRQTYIVLRIFRSLHVEEFEGNPKLWGPETSTKHFFYLILFGKAFWCQIASF